MDLSSVRTEIKAWERSFKTSNGRDPTIKDIKDQPAIAGKYRLYKRLSKSAPSTSTHEPPSTPPKSRSRASHPQPTLLLSKPRALECTAPLTTFNPFSPQKNKGKQKDLTTIAADFRDNPFASSAARIKTRGPSPDPFPVILPSRPSAATFTPTLPPPDPVSAVSRARKRLRGEPVSPSPNKEKRRRIGSSQPTLPFHRVNSDSPRSSDEDEMDLSFVTDSPVKAPAGGKTFKLLFEESTGPVSTSLLKGKGKAPSRQATSSGRRSSERSPSLLSNIDEEWSVNGAKADGFTKTIDGKVSSRRGPSADALFTSNGLQNTIQLSDAAKAGIPTSIKNKPPDIRTSSKRSLSDIKLKPLDVAGVGPSLLPPSPVSADPSSYRASNFKGRGKAIAKSTSGRKKAKIVDADGDLDDDDSDKSNTNVKILDRIQMRLHRTTKATAGGGDDDDDLSFDSDPILGYSRRGVPRGSHGTTLPLRAELEEEYSTGEFEVILPDKLRRMLALEPVEAKARDSQEKRVVKGLMYGRRASHYDPVKGGEIWDVGEDNVRGHGGEEAERDTEGEDDWEGEPVPWEVGEL